MKTNVSSKIPPEDIAAVFSVVFFLLGIAMTLAVVWASPWAADRVCYQDPTAIATATRQPTATPVPTYTPKP